MSNTVTLPKDVNFGGNGINNNRDAIMSNLDNLIKNIFSNQTNIKGFFETENLLTFLKDLQQSSQNIDNEDIILLLQKNEKTIIDGFKAIYFDDPCNLNTIYYNLVDSKILFFDQYIKKACSQCGSILLQNLSSLSNADNSSNNVNSLDDQSKILEVYAGAFTALTNENNKNDANVQYLKDLNDQEQNNNLSSNELQEQLSYNNIQLLELKTSLDTTLKSIDNNLSASSNPYDYLTTQSLFALYKNMMQNFMDCSLVYGKYINTKSKDIKELQDNLNNISIVLTVIGGILQEAKARLQNIESEKRKTDSTYQVATISELTVRSDKEEQTGARNWDFYVEFYKVNADKNGKKPTGAPYYATQVFYIECDISHAIYENYKNNPYVSSSPDNNALYVDKKKLSDGIDTSILQANLMLGMQYNAGSFKIEGQSSTTISASTNTISKITQGLNDLLTALNNKLSQAVDSVSKAYDFCKRSVDFYVSNR